MGHFQPLHRITVGRSREARGPDGMEMAVAIMIITGVMIMGLWLGLRLIPMVQTLNAVTLVSSPANNEIIYYAEHGRWPAADDPYVNAGARTGGHVTAVTLGGDGVITAQLTLGPTPVAGAAAPATPAGRVQGALSFRPQLLGSRDAPTVTFLCGHAQPVAGEVATSGANLTTLDTPVLPPFCR